MSTSNETPNTQPASTGPASTDQPSEREVSSAVSRRTLLKASVMGGAAFAAAPILAACGGGSKSSGGGIAAASNSLSGAAGSDVQNIKNFIGPIDAQHAAKGMAYDLGAVLAFSGPGAFFGRTMSNGMKLAQKHIIALGGPNFNLVFKDHKSGDPQAGVQAVKELGFAKVPSMLASYVDDLGAMLPGQAQYKIFTLDGGGGTSTFAQGKPYFWGTRAITPNDTWPGTIRWVKDKFPNTKKISSVNWDLGTLNAPNENDLRRQLTAGGLTMGIYGLAKVGATDYSAVLQKVKSDNPDVVFLGIFGNDPGVFMKQYVTSGINKPVVIPEYTQPAADIAGSAYDGQYLSFDYFNADTPDNGWSKIFIDEYQKAFNVKPDYYAANYYEDTFAIWDIMRRVLASGGDVKDGLAMNKAFESKLQFPSVYGGDANTAGVTVLSPTTHSVTRRPMTLSVYKNKKVVPLAYFNIEGADYRQA